MSKNVLDTLTPTELVALATNGTLPQSAKRALQEQATEKLTGEQQISQRLRLKVTMSGYVDVYPQDIEEMVGVPLPKLQDVAAEIANDTDMIARNLINEDYGGAFSAKITMEYDD